MYLSIFQEWINSAAAFISKLWSGILEEDEFVDLSNLDAVKWGTEHEKDGADSYNATHRLSACLAPSLAGTLHYIVE